MQYLLQVIGQSYAVAGTFSGSLLRSVLVSTTFFNYVIYFLLDITVVVFFLLCVIVPYFGTISCQSWIIDKCDVIVLKRAFVIFPYLFSTKKGKSKIKWMLISFFFVGQKRNHSQKKLFIQDKHSIILIHKFWKDLKKSHLRATENWKSDFVCIFIRFIKYLLGVSFTSVRQRLRIFSA